MIGIEIKVAVTEKTYDAMQNMSIGIVVMGHYVAHAYSYSLLAGRTAKDLYRYVWRHTCHISPVKSNYVDLWEPTKARTVDKFKEW